MKVCDHVNQQKNQIKAKMEFLLAQQILNTLQIKVQFYSPLINAQKTDRIKPAFRIPHYTEVEKWLDLNDEIQASLQKGFNENDNFMDKIIYLKNKLPKNSNDFQSLLIKVSLETIAKKNDLIVEQKRQIYEKLQENKGKLKLIRQGAYNLSRWRGGFLIPPNLQAVL